MYVYIRYITQYVDLSVISLSMMGFNHLDHLNGFGMPRSFEQLSATPPVATMAKGPGMPVYKESNGGWVCFRRPWIPNGEIHDFHHLGNL